MEKYIRESDAVQTVMEKPDMTPDEKAGIIRRLQAIPAADVEPVVRGKWIPKSADGSWRVDTCSSCKTDTHYVRYAHAYDFCPNCGADMRETKTE